MGGAIHLIPIHLHGVHKDDFNLAAYFRGGWLIYAKLTLRLLMSYIYIYMERIFLMFLDHTQRRSTVGRTPLDE